MSGNLTAEEKALYTKALKEFHKGQGRILQHPPKEAGPMEKNPANEALHLEINLLTGLGHGKEVALKESLQGDVWVLASKAGLKPLRQDAPYLDNMKLPADAKALPNLNPDEQQRLQEAGDQLRKVNQALQAAEDASPQAKLFAAIHKVERGGR